ncbi:alpha/beta hydrolase [Empedobacter falsenii]|uniref:alpha/beta fold hydrolase n=1 Tax=unclassified Empedobacter TaxID=2643773 RepID=UPI002576BAD6|nr:MULTISPECIES: alpha/beta hydrolase [unclassified Empedobacter]MDM1524114.1 alpha/beta hydrolase [Empedobacter sp. 225-1]MDM1544051.1 alpha/beta hydrolase [Empedobacter sp. 189-2]
MEIQTCLEINDAKIHYIHHEINPERPTLIFLHDSLGCTQLWRDFPKEVAEKSNCNLFIYDRKGYGKSSPFTIDRRELTYMHDEADFLNQLVNHFNFKEIILFGHSDGGTIALLYAAKYHKNLKGIVVVGSHVIVEEITLNGIRAAKIAYAETNLKERLRKYHGDNTQKVFEMWTETWLRTDFVNFDIREELKNIKCPTLVIQGIDDEFGTMEQVIGIIDNVNGRKENYIVPDAKHTPFRENKVPTFEKTIEFIDTL